MSARLGFHTADRITRQRGRLIAGVRARGAQPRDLRDAAHEAAHALRTGLAGRWTRDRIHAAVLAAAPEPHDLLAAELEARAVELLVCQQLGELYDIEHWAEVCRRDTERVLRATLLVSVAELAAEIERRAKEGGAVALAKRVGRIR